MGSEEYQTFENETKTESKPEAPPPPKDNYNMFVGIFLWIGIGCLMPWNFFINATDYWMYKFRDIHPSNHTDPYLNKEHDDVKSDLQLKWNSYLSISNMIPNLMVLFFNATCGHKFALAPRLIIGQLIIIAIFAGTDAMTFIDTDQYQNGFLIGTLVSVVFISAMVGLVQGSQAALAALFPPIYMGTFMQGQAVGGIVVALLNIVTIAVGSDSVHSASWSFLIGTLFTVSSLALYIASTRFEFYKHYVCNGQANDAEDRQPLVEENANTDISAVPEETSTFQIVCKIWPWIITIFTTFTVTLMLFPAVAVLVESTRKGSGEQWTDVYFTPVACFLVFNVGDYIGRALSTTISWPKIPSQAAVPMMVAAFARIAFIPLFLFCNACPSNRVVSDVYIKSDAAFIIFMILFSVSNGYINSICLMHGPKTLNNPQDQSRAASILVFYLMFGLTIGAIFSTPLLHLI